MITKLIKLMVISVLVFFLSTSESLAWFSGESGAGPKPPSGILPGGNNRSVGLNANKIRFLGMSSVKRKSNYKEGELLVKFKKDAPEHEKQNLHKKRGSEMIKEFKSLRLHHVKLKKGLDVQEAAKLYRQDPNVEYAEPNFLYNVQAIPNDPRFGEMWGLRNTGQTGGTVNADINAPGAWNTTTGSSNVVVAVIDTGVDYTHPDLSANMWRDPWETAGNGIDDDHNGYVDDVYGIDVVNNDGNPMDDYGHGTHVAGTIGAAGGNGVGVVGVNWNVKIMACKFLGSNGSGSTDGAVTCLQYIKVMKDKGVNIVATSNSWGGGGYSQALYDAIAAMPDVLFVAAAGNSSADNDTSDAYPANYDLPNVIAVAATDYNDQLAYFSDYGKDSVHVGAPGVSILSTLPAQNAWNITGGYGLLSGTSMATPHVSGLAALLKAQDPSRDWKSIKNLILSGGDSVTALNGKTITGKRINAAGSVTCVNRPVLSVRGIPKTITSGVPITLSVVSINCAAAAGPVYVTASGGETITLRDDGNGLDKAAGDGVFTGVWNPTLDAEKLDISSPAGALSVVVPALLIFQHLPEANIHAPYRQQLGGSGGFKPYSWAIVSGGLPPGLSLEDSGGVISGTATVTGTYSFTVQMTDAMGYTLSAELSLTVADDYVLESSAQSYDSGDTDFGYAVTADSDGNYYLARSSMVAANKSYDAFISKYDPAGALIWARTYATALHDQPQGIKVDGSGNVYVGGNSQKWWDEGITQWFLVKYDSSGNIQWSRTYSSGIDDFFSGIALDSGGNAYVTGTSGWNAQVVTLKYDPSGNLLWEKTDTHTQSFMSGYAYGSGAAIDSNGNIYVGGGIGSVTSVPDPNNPGWYCSTSNDLMVKYDPSGNEVWANTLGQVQYGLCTAWLAMGNRGGVAVDAADNVYITGSPSPIWDDGCTTIKYDAAGNIVWQVAYGGAVHCNDIAVDNDGNAFIAASKGTYSYVDGWKYFFSVLKYDPQGNLLWEKNLAAGHETLTNGIPGAFGIALAGNGDIHVTGYTLNGADYDALSVVLKEIASPLKIVSVTLGSGIKNLIYREELSATGGSKPYSWTLVSGALPPGLSLDSSTGVISGTPTSSGAYTFSLQATDTSATPASVSKTFTIDILAVSPVTLPIGALGATYSQMLSVTAGTFSSYNWTLSGGTLPPGLTMTSNSSTNTISGTPNTAGIFSFTLKISDTTRTALFPLSISIFGIKTPLLPDTEIDASYTSPLAADYGKAPYSWSIISGALPPGLSLDKTTGTVSGRPTASGTFTFTVQAADANSLKTARQLSIIVHNRVSIVSVTLRSGSSGKAYSDTFSASGGSASYTWSVVSGSLPPGITLDRATGILSGIPAAVGTFSFTVGVCDTFGVCADRTFSLSISYAPMVEAAFSAPNGVKAHQYNASLAVTGGLPPYAWSVASGTLPPGVTLNSSTGMLSGTPAATGSFACIVNLRDSSSAMVSGSLNITVYDTPVITSAAPPDGTSGTPYRHSLAATNGLAPYTWIVTEGTLPTGLTLDSNTGILSGNPLAVGIFSFKIEVRDANAATASASYSLTITYAPPVIAAAIPAGTYSLPYNETIPVTGGLPPFTWSIVTGYLPPGLSMDSATGEISGTPTTPGRYDFTVKVTDARANNAVQTLSLGIYFKITPASLLMGAVNTAYSQILGATGSIGPYTWAISDGYLPPGLTLNATSGKITGVPTSAGDFAFTVSISDYQNRTSFIPLSITVAEWVKTYGNYATARSIAVDGDHNSYVTGTTYCSSNYFPVTVKYDSSGNVQWEKFLSGNSLTTDTHGNFYLTGKKDTNCLTVKYDPAFNVIWEKKYFPAGTIASEGSNGKKIIVDILGNIYVAGETSDIIWNSDHSAGYYKQGLFVIKYDSSGNLLWNRYVGDGGYYFGVSATGISFDGNGNVYAVGGSDAAGLIIKLDPDGNELWRKLSNSYTAAVVTDDDGGVYVAGSGGITKYDSAGNTVWTKSFPSSSFGAITRDGSGKLYATGSTYNGGSDTYTVKFDTSGNILQSYGFDGGNNESASDIAVDQSGTIYLTGYSSNSQGYNFLTLKFPSLCLYVLPANFSSGTIGETYSQTLAATNGSAPYTWAISSGALPEGLTLNGTTGVVSGSPTTAGTYSFVIQVRDAGGHTADRPFTMTVNVPGIITASLPAGTVAAPYSQTLKTGRTTPGTWTVLSGALPPGLSLDSGTGTLGAIPTTAGTYSFIVQLMDANSVKDTRAFTMTINPPPATTTTQNFSMEMNKPYVCYLTVPGGAPTGSWTITAGNLPPGLALSAAGQISGTPTTVGTYIFTVAVKDVNGVNVTKLVTIWVCQPITPPTEQSIQSVYDAMANGGIARFQAVEYTEDVSFNRNITATLKGGYDSAYSANGGHTIVHGRLRFTAGTTKLENIAVQW